MFDHSCLVYATELTFALANGYHKAEMPSKCGGRVLLLHKKRVHDNDLAMNTTHQA